MPEGVNRLGTLLPGQMPVQLVPDSDIQGSGSVNNAIFNIGVHELVPAIILAASSLFGNITGLDLPENEGGARHLRVSMYQQFIPAFELPPQVVFFSSSTTAGTSSATGSLVIGTPVTTNATEPVWANTADLLINNGRRVYVSSSQGSDANSGLTESAPVATIAQGKTLIRDGFGDQLCLRRGDRWNEAIGTWNFSGVPASNVPQGSPEGTGYAWITWYGNTSDPRPVVNNGASSAITSSGVLSRWGVDGIDMFNHSRVPGGPDEDPVAIGAVMRGIDIGSANSDMRGFIVQDCRIAYQARGLDISRTPPTGGANHAIPFFFDIVIRGCQFYRNYNSIPTDHGQGIFMHRCQNVTIEHNYIDHNGWHEAPYLPNPGTVSRSHNTYLTTGCSEVLYRENIIMRASNKGIQPRAGGTILRNVLIGNPLSIETGATPGSTHWDTNGYQSVVEGNLITWGDDTPAGESRNQGVIIGHTLEGVDNSCSDNLVCFEIATIPFNTRGIRVLGYSDRDDWFADEPTSFFAGARDLRVERNTIYNWGNGIQNWQEFNNGSTFQETNNNLRYQYNVIRGTSSENGAGSLELPCFDLDLSSAAPTFFEVTSRYTVNRNSYYHTSTNLVDWLDLGGVDMDPTTWATPPGVGGTGGTGESIASLEEPDFVDPTRNFGAYVQANVSNQLVTQEAYTTMDFFAEVVIDGVDNNGVDHRRYAWRTELTAGSINSWMRAGFEINQAWIDARPTFAAQPMGITQIGINSVSMVPNSSILGFSTLAGTITGPTQILSLNPSGPMAGSGSATGNAVIAAPTPLSGVAQGIGNAQGTFGVIILSGVAVGVGNATLAVPLRLIERVGGSDACTCKCGFAPQVLHVWNIAMTALGQPCITDIDEPTMQAKQIKCIWDTYRRNFLACHPWNGAKRTERLAQNSTTPAGSRWAHSYDLRSNILRPLKINGTEVSEGLDLWEIEIDECFTRQRILTDATTVDLEYIVDVVNVNTLGPTTVTALGLGLAEMLAPMHVSVQAQNRISFMAREAMKKARVVDSQIGSQHVTTPFDELYNTRF